MGKGGGSQPDAPDYNSLARIQGVFDRDAAERQTAANRVNQNNPYQSLTWENNPTEQRVFDADAYADALDRRSKMVAWGIDPGAALDRNDFYRNEMVDNWTQNVTLRPELQGALDTQMGAVGGLMGQAVDNLGQPLDLGGLTNVQGLDLSGLPGRPDSGFGAVQEVQDAMMGRLNPALQQGRDREVQRLKAQGITEGSPAWESAMRSLNQQDVDANQQALLGAMGAYGDIFNRGMSSRDQALNEALQSRGASIDDRSRELQEMLLERNQPLQDLQSLMSGGSIQTPGFEGYTQATPWQAPDFMGAAQQQYSDEMGRYNAQQAANAQGMSGLLGLAGSLGSAFMLSDRRLKRDIIKIGRDKTTGLNLYKFRYIWDKTRHFIGVMAGEVAKVYPDAIGYRGGYMTVDYGKLGLTMREA